MTTTKGNEKVKSLTIKQQTGSDNTFVARWSYGKTVKTTTSTSSGSIKKGDKVTIKSGAKWYNGTSISSWVMSETWIVYSVSGSRVVINQNVKKTHKIMSPINVKYLNKVGGSSSTTTTKTTTKTMYPDKFEGYQVWWSYATGDGIWYTTYSEWDFTKQKYHLFNVSENYTKLKVTVRPVSKENSKDNNKRYWVGGKQVCTYDIMKLGNPETPSTPSVKIDKYQLTATVDNISDPRSDKITFELYDGTTKVKSATSKVLACMASAVFAITPTGKNYRVRCRAENEITKAKSDWSQFSDGGSTIPAAPSKITTCEAKTSSSIYLEWTTVKTAKTYEVQYAIKREYLEGSYNTSSINNIETTNCEVTGLSLGETYFFRVRAANDQGSSGWSEIKSCVFGKKPSAPTTWSSSTTVITGESLNLYWVHNSEDNSAEKKAELELIVDGVKQDPIEIEKSTKEEEKYKTSVYPIDTSVYVEGTKIQWRVRTCGITGEYGDWSMQRVIDIYAPATLTLKMNDINGEAIEILNSFPFYVEFVVGPDTQTPVGYHLSIVSNESYETIDIIGNVKNISAGDELYSKYIDAENPIVEFSANNIDLETDKSYTIKGLVSMNSGLTAEDSVIFSVDWNDVTYDTGADITIDESNYSAHIRPYCTQSVLKYYNLEIDSETGNYKVTTEITDPVEGEVVADVVTNDGGDVFYNEGLDLYFCEIYEEEDVPVENISLAVYRREFDGTFTEIAKNVYQDNNGHVVDPHPALDYARYRIVATEVTTGAVSFSDVSEQSIDNPAIIIQWDEAWSDYNVDDETDAVPEEPAWAGSLLKLPYNIDVSDNNTPDVTLAEYIGRSHPVSYYGTQLGSTATWNFDIIKDDSETLYGLRRLQRWMGDVYVREPSGSGYWANVKVSFSQKHMDLVIPVSLTISRVEGGM